MEGFWTRNNIEDYRVKGENGAMTRGVPASLKDEFMEEFRSILRASEYISSHAVIMEIFPDCSSEYDTFIQEFLTKYSLSHVKVFCPMKNCHVLGIPVEMKQLFIKELMAESKEEKLLPYKDILYEASGDEMSQDTQRSFISKFIKRYGLSHVKVNSEYFNGTCIGIPLNMKTLFLKEAKVGNSNLRNILTFI